MSLIMQSTRHLLQTRARSLPQLSVRHLGSSRISPNRPFKTTADKQPFFSPSLRPAPRTRPLLQRLLDRAYSGQSGPSFSTGSGRGSLLAIIYLNAGVFGSWLYADYAQDRKLMRKLHQNFTLSEQNLRDGRYWTLLTSAFSHMNTMHFVFNMFALHAFGSVMSTIPGVRAVHVWTLVMGSGIAGSVGWLWHRRLLAERKGTEKRFNPYGMFGERARTIQIALGASGVAMGMGATAALLCPLAPMSLMFIPVPIPLWVITLGYFAVDAYYLDSEKTGIGHSAHLAGAAYGAVYYLAYLRRFGGVWSLLRYRR